MSDADYLRETAALIREKATHPNLSAGPWFASPHGDVHDDGSLWVCDTQSGEAAEHIASWSPPVALAVAALLEQEGQVCECGDCEPPRRVSAHALAVARAWRGDA